MTNVEKLEFLISSYIYTRATELLSGIDAENMNCRWIAEMLPKIPMQLYK